MPANSRVNLLILSVFLRMGVDYYAFLRNLLGKIAHRSRGDVREPEMTKRA